MTVIRIGKSGFPENLELTKLPMSELDFYITGKTVMIPTKQAKKLAMVCKWIAESSNEFEYLQKVLDLQNPKSSSDGRKN